MRDPSGGCGLIFLLGGFFLGLGVEGILKLRIDLLHEKVTSVLVIMCPLWLRAEAILLDGHILYLKVEKKKKKKLL
jgi:hypothetical protein